MTDTAVPSSTSLFHSPLGLFDFQSEHTAQAYWAWTQTPEPVRLVLHDTGLGKTVLTLATAALAFEDDEIDVLLVVADAGKVLDWARIEAPKFTDLTVAEYMGAKRKRHLDADPHPQVLVTSWATSRIDIGTFKPRGRSIIKDGPLIEFLRGKRVGIAFDETSALSSRSSKTYLAWEYLLRTLRKAGPPPKMLGLTATSVERSPETHFNVCRLLSPERAPRVADFYANYVAAWDLHDNPVRWKNLTPEDLVDPGVPAFNRIFAPITLRKRKTDPDVIEQFPSKMEKPPTFVSLSRDHAGLYDAVEESFSDQSLSEDEQRAGFTLLRMLAGHPASLIGSTGKYAKEVVDLVGISALRQMSVSKVEAMLAWQEAMASQQTVIFTFYGRTVLPLLHAALVSHGYEVSVNHGGMNSEERQRSQQEFKGGETQIFLSSDAGAKGLNLGVGSGLLHYELPLLFSTYDQRSNRIHRIDSAHPSVTVDSLIARGTVEEPLAEVMMRRNRWTEQVQDADYDDYRGDPGEGFLRASDRVAMMRRAKK